MNEDGSYQEEGQKNTKGFIWGKVRLLSNLYLASFFPLKGKYHYFLFYFKLRYFLHFLIGGTFQAGTKLLCAVLSLPVPCKSSNHGGEQVSSTISRSMPDYLEQRAIQKLLLIGYSGSGTSTVFKQVTLKIFPDLLFVEA